MSAAASADARRGDARARERAQREFVRPLVLEAGAGTGKTAVLVARLVAWCLGPGWERNEERLAAEPEDRVAAETLRRVVAITFTEAAAAEMEDRVREALGEIEQQRRPTGVVPDALPADPAQAAQRARLLLGCLDQLGVRTIHAWCRRLLAAHPLEVGLHPRFEVDADGRRQAEVAREVLERRLAEAYSGDAMADHLALALEGQGPGAIEEALVYLVDQGVDAAELARDPFGAEAVAALAQRVGEACRDLARQGGEQLCDLPGAPKLAETAGFVVEAAARLAAGCAGPAALAEVFAPWQKSHLDQLQKWAAGKPGKKALERLGACSPDFCEAARSLRARILHLRGLDPEALARARRVLEGPLAEVSEELRRRGVESFDALLRDASRLVAGAAGARVRAEIDQLLVDEFQDTDGTQCEILRQLVLAAPETERPGLFLVGDPKQSIFGWRRADLAAWYDFVAELEALGGETHQLVVNFRSVPEVLDEVARIVRPVMQARPRLQPAFQELVPCPGLAGEAGFQAGGRRAVEHWVAWDWDAETRQRVRTATRDATELEAGAIARDMAELHDGHGVPWSEFALLLRSLGELDVYLEALRDAGVPYVVERDQSYYQRREIVEAQAWVRAVLAPFDAVALVALLRSPWVGVPDAALVPLWKAELPSRVARLRDAGAGARLEIRRLVEAAVAGMPTGLPGLERLEGWSESLVAALECLGALRESFDREPADRFVERLRGALACEASEAARYLGRFRLANLDRFFRDLVTALDETGGDAAAVLAHLRRAVSDRREAEEGRPRDPADQAVQVTTIHKAKGLGFGHVYLAQIQKGEPSGQDKTPRAAPGEHGIEYRLFGRATPGFDRTGEDEQALRASERVRLLYVAATRAKRRLVVCGAWREEPLAQLARASSFADLVSLRAEPGVLAACMEACAERSSEDVTDDDGVRWRFPVLASKPGPRRAVGAGAFDEAAALAVARRLAAARQEAARHEQRRFSAPASRKEEAAEGAEPTALPAAAALARETAMRAGSAVHAALEHLDAAAPREARRRQGREHIERVLAAGAPGPGLEPARVSALHDFDAFLDGPLFVRFAEIAPSIVARELPVLLAPRGETDPVGFVSGSIDLVYRQGERWVVADYKTGAASDERLDDYRRQGAVYTRALREALGLDERPDFELWLLDSGQIEQVPADS